MIVMAAALVLAVPGARAAGEDADGTGGTGGATPAGVRRGPATALVAAAAYPGLGQLVVGSEMKAAAVGAAQAYIVARLILEDRWTRHALRLYNETGGASYYDDYSEHYDRRQTLVWWALAVGILSVADAYVDAHLVGFDDPPGRPGMSELEPEARHVGDDGLRVGLAVRF